MLPQEFLFRVCEPWDPGYLSRYFKRSTGCMIRSSNPGISILALASTQTPIPMTSFAGGRATGPDDDLSPLHLSLRLRISGYIPPPPTCLHGVGSENLTFQHSAC